MQIGFILLAHQNPIYLRRLIDKLIPVADHIFLHIDRGVTAQTYSAFRAQLADVETVGWLKRHYSHWGSFGLVQAALAGLEQAQASQCDYVILLSGQDYLLKPATMLKQFLRDHNGLSFIQHYALPSPEWPKDGSDRFNHWHFNLMLRPVWLKTKVNHALYKIFNTVWPQRPLPSDLAPYGGSQWWCLHRTGVDYVLEFTRNHSRAVNFFKYIRIPDEAYFHTLLLNSPLKRALVNRTLTYVDWNGPPYPRVLRRGDLGTLATRDCFFARKFDPVIDSEILDQIDNQLLN